LIKTRHIFLALWLIGFLPLICRADVLRVCESCEYQTLCAAVEASLPGDEIQVEPGWYREISVVINKPLHLKGIGFPVIDGEGLGEVLTVVADHVTIEGFDIRNVGTSYMEDRAGIRIRNSGDFLIRNNRLWNTFFGVYLEHARNGVVTGNTIVGEAVEEMSSGNAIHIWYCKKITVTDNVVRDHRDGIYLEFGDSCLVQGNLSTGNLRYGLHFMFSNDDEYRGNTFRDNGAGVAVMFSRRIGMHSNVFSFNWGKASYGLLLKEIYDADIRRNDFTENTIGIYVEGSTRINYMDNNFSRNGWALKISGGCLDNKIENNNFLSNTFDLAMNSAPGDNLLAGNFWSDYNGYDLDRDGVGDVPYRPVKLFNFIVNRTPEAMVLLRSLFVDIINFSEKVSPVFTPAEVVDNSPSMNRIQWK
jgi:nitrous oxidase accessory protein